MNTDRIISEVNEYKQFLSESKNYKYTTIKSYSAAYRGLLFYYPGKKSIDISEDEINKYLEITVRSKSPARSSVQTMLATFETVYNKIYDKNYRLSVKLPPVVFTKPEYIKQYDIFNFINSIENVKHKAIIALMYSCGLNHEELLSIQVGDVKSDLNRIFIYDENRKATRSPYLSQTVLTYLRDYYKEYKPKYYLFEGQGGGKYTSKSTQTFFKKLANKFGLHRDTTPFDLRHSYIKHMVLTGTPIAFVLKSMNIHSNQSNEKYARLIYGDSTVNYSPFDRLVVQLDNRDEDIQKIEFSIKTLQEDDERDYLLEGLQCLRTGAKRASVVMIWNAAIRRIQNRILENYSLKEINAELKKVYSKSKVIKSVDDFQYTKEANVISIASTLGMFDKFEKNILIENCLGLRNKCGHPTKYRPELIRITAFIEDVIAICFIK